MITVYVVEDCLLYQSLVMEIFQANQASCLGCRSIQEALQAMLMAPPDLIILEPLMDQRRGFSYFEQIRQDPTTRYIPIVLVTAASRSTVRDLLETEGGLTFYRSKPCDPNELVAIAQAL